jgi:hypothetical protein
MPLIRSRADIDSLLGGPTPAEEKLLAATLAGEPCVLGDSVPPEGRSDPAVHIRADVLRYLITGGCDSHPVADSGVNLVGAHIEDLLNIDFVTAVGRTCIVASAFDKPISAIQARLQYLDFSHSRFPELNAERMRVLGSAFFRKVESSGPVTFPGVRIGGQLSLNGAILGAAQGMSVNAQSAKVTSSILFREAHATGQVTFMSSSVGGQLNCRASSFLAIDADALNIERAQISGDLVLDSVVATASVSISGARIGGQLDCDNAHFSAPNNTALNAQLSSAAQGMLFRNVKIGRGRISLISAHVGSLLDDPNSWPQGDRFHLNNFCYDFIYDTNFSKFADRLDWLKNGSLVNGNFYASPYTHLANVYQRMGREKEAREVLFERERLRRIHARQHSQIEPDGEVSVAFHSLWRDLMNLMQYSADLVFRWVVGYGLYPFRSLYILAGLTILATLLAHLAWEEGSMAPNSDTILTSAEWIAATEDSDNPAQAWSAKFGAGQDWASFNRYAFAADLVIPIIDLGQTEAWAPSTNRGIWGQRLWRYGFFLTIAGWIVTALGAAAITGIIRRD